MLCFDYKSPMLYYFFSLISMTFGYSMVTPTASAESYLTPTTINVDPRNAGRIDCVGNFPLQWSFFCGDPNFGYQCVISSVDTTGAAYNGETALNLAKAMSVNSCIVTSLSTEQAFSLTLGGPNKTLPTHLFNCIDSAQNILPAASNQPIICWNGAATPIQNFAQLTYEGFFDPHSPFEGPGCTFTPQAGTTNATMNCQVYIPTPNTIAGGQVVDSTVTYGCTLNYNSYDALLESLYIATPMFNQNTDSVVTSIDYGPTTFDSVTYQHVGLSWAITGYNYYNCIDLYGLGTQLPFTLRCSRSMNTKSPTASTGVILWQDSVSYNVDPNSLGVFKVGCGELSPPTTSKKLMKP